MSIEARVAANGPDGMQIQRGAVVVGANVRAGGRSRQPQPGVFDGWRRCPGPDELGCRIITEGNDDLAGLFESDCVRLPDGAGGELNTVAVVVGRLKQDGFRQGGRDRLERFVAVSGCTCCAGGERQVPRSGCPGVESDGWRLMRGRDRGVGLDKDGVVCQRRAVEAVDPEADHARGKVLAINPPGCVGVFKNQVGGLKAEIGDPEGDRRARNGDVDDDRPIDGEAQISRARGQSARGAGAGKEPRSRGTRVPSVRVRSESG